MLPIACRVAPSIHAGGILAEGRGVGRAGGGGGGSVGAVVTEGHGGGGSVESGLDGGPEHVAAVAGGGAGAEGLNNL